MLPATNGGTCSVSSTVTMTCRDCSTISSEIGVCEQSIATTTFYVKSETNGGSKCASETIAVGPCNDVISSEKKNIAPRFLEFFLLFLL